jgi:hypothetical protein
MWTRRRRHSNTRERAVSFGYTVAAGRQEIRVKASASDTILFDAGIKGTSRIHDFVFDAATSTSATYGTAGTFLGFRFHRQDGREHRRRDLHRMPGDQC